MAMGDPPLLHPGAVHTVPHTGRVMGGVYGPTSMPEYDPFGDRMSPKFMIAMRLLGRDRRMEGQRLPFHALEVIQLRDKYVVCVAKTLEDEQVVCIEDNIDLFPSDQLITQLRLLAG